MQKKKKDLALRQSYFSGALAKRILQLKYIFVKHPNDRRSQNI